jgi:hypothetical protein
VYKIINATKRAAVRTAYAKRTRHIINRITFGHYVTTLGIRSFVSDKVVVTDGLLSLSVTQVLNGDEDATVGSVGSSSYSATFNNPSPTYNYRDKIAFIESGVLLADGTYYYTPCGYFATEKPETDDDGKTLTVTGYDEIDKMGGKWTPSITVTDTTTLKDVVENIASMHGLSVTYVDTAAQTALKNHVIGVATAAELTEQSERDVLGYCVGCAGMSARVNTVGKLYISWFFSPGSTYDYTVTADVQWENGFKKSAESAVKIEAVTAGEDEDVYTKGTGVPLSFVNPLVTHAEIDAIYARYNGRTWYPSTCTWRGDPCVEVGDIITVKDKNNKSYTVYVAQQELDLSGGLQSTITSPNIDTTEMSFDSVSASVKLELSKVKNSMEAAIKAATDAINGANGGYYRILDLDKDGNPDGWECFATDGLQGVKCTYGGIGCTTDGGKTYTNAMTGAGINATAITTGIITGGTNGFSFNLETGHIEASDINITGGDINLDGGQLSVLNDDGYKADLSSGVLDLYQGAGTGTGEKYLTFGSSMLFETALGGDWYATIAAPEFTLGERSSKGFRFGTSTVNASAAKPAVGGLAYNWDTDFAIIEKSRTRIRQCVETNEAKNDQFESLIHHRPVGGTNFKLGVGIAKMNAEKTPGAGFEIRGETSGKLWAGLYAWTEADNIMRLTFRTSNQDGTTYSKTLTANGELLYFNGRRLKFADE